MSDLRTAAQQALWTLEGWNNYGKWVWPKSAIKQAKRNTTEAITALRAALATVPSDCPPDSHQPVQEPVAWQWLDTAHFRRKIPAHSTPSEWRPLYTTPPQRGPLTEEEIDQEYKKGYADGYAAGYDNGDSEGFTRGTDSMVPSSLAAWRAQTLPLTEEEMRECAQAMDAEPLAEGWPELIKFARAIERAHGITK